MRASGIACHPRPVDPNRAIRHPALPMGVNDGSRISTRLRRAPTRYAPVALIARGGMAEVWKADAVFETGEKHLVAIKRVLPQLQDDRLYRSMFEDEARLGMLLRHPNIVRVYDARDIGGTFIMIMELVDGTSLKSMLERAHLRGAAMPLAAALHVARDLASALAYAHTAEAPDGHRLGIIHRDVSPHNLLLGKTGSVKLADFGLADASVHHTSLGSGMLGGKLGYLAPEIIEQKPATPAIDIFAVGIVLWEMLCGRRLFHGTDDAGTVRAVAKCEVPPPSSLNRKVPAAIDRVVLRALARDPAQRTPTAYALSEDLSAAIQSVDRDVSYRDVSLLVNLHLATEPKVQTASSLGAALFAQELEAFVNAAGGADLGAAPLDPDLFREPSRG
jgi:serine/threonine protein kinase